MIIKRMNECFLRNLKTFTECFYLNDIKNADALLYSIISIKKKRLIFFKKRYKTFDSENVFKVISNFRQF